MSINFQSYSATIRRTTVGGAEPQRQQSPIEQARNRSGTMSSPLALTPITPWRPQRPTTRLIEPAIRERAARLLQQQVPPARPGPGRGPR